MYENRQTVSRRKWLQQYSFCDKTSKAHYPEVKEPNRSYQLTSRAVIEHTSEFVIKLLSHGNSLGPREDENQSLYPQFKQINQSGIEKARCSSA